MAHPVFELITPPGGPWARMFGFTNDLTNFLGFPALGAIIPNFLGWETIDIQNEIKFHDLIPRLGHFWSVTSE